MVESCEIRVILGVVEMASNQILPSTLMQAFLGCGFGDDQGYVTVADDHSGRKEMLHDFNGIVSIGLTRSSPVVTA